MAHSTCTLSPTIFNSFPFHSMYLFILYSLSLFKQRICSNHVWGTLAGILVQFDSVLEFLAHNRSFISSLLTLILTTIACASRVLFIYLFICRSTNSSDWICNLFAADILIFYNFLFLWFFRLLKLLWLLKTVSLSFLVVFYDYARAYRCFVCRTNLWSQWMVCFYYFLFFNFGIGLRCFEGLSKRTLFSLFI